MPVTILCPKLTCRAVLRVPDSVRGKRIRCGECGTAFMVPEQQIAKTTPATRPQEPQAEPAESAAEA
jgi:predicted Zn finger-like uncharacterized protein